MAARKKPLKFVTADIEEWPAADLSLWDKDVTKNDPLYFDGALLGRIARVERDVLNLQVALRKLARGTEKKKLR